MTLLVEEPAVAGADAELFARLRDSDAAALTQVMRQNNQRLYRLARGILRDTAEAEDAVQDGYVHAFTRLDSFRGEASLATWLARIVTNEALGRLRRRRPAVDIDEVAGLPAERTQASRSDPAASPEHSAARREIRLTIERAIDALPAAFRTVFILRALEQLSVKETGAFLGIPEETVKTRFHRANRLLRRALSEQFASIWEDAFPFAGSRCDRLVANVLARLKAAPS